MNDNESSECPLCMEPYEIDDLNFFPCTCGYQVCRFCWHRIRTDENGLCPACRKAYTEDPAIFQPLTSDEVQQIKKDRKQRDQHKRHQMSESRKHLSSVRVIQKNLLFVVGLSNKLADAEVLKRSDMFGKYGKIVKIVINPSTNYAGPQGPSASAYITYSCGEETQQAILGVNNVMMDGRILRASLGTTKYCSYFLKNASCPKTDCMYLHEVADEAASFTKEDMQLGKHQIFERHLLERYIASNAASSSSDGTPKSLSTSPASEVKKSASPVTTASHDQASVSSTNSSSRPSSVNSDVKPPLNGQSVSHKNYPQELEPNQGASTAARSTENDRDTYIKADDDLLALKSPSNTSDTRNGSRSLDAGFSDNPVLQLMQGWPMQHNPDSAAQHNGMWPDSDLGLSNLHDPADDDLDFDPFEESNIALTDLINKESAALSGDSARHGIDAASSRNIQHLWEQPLPTFHNNSFGFNQHEADRNQQYSLFGAGLMQDPGYHHSGIADANPLPTGHYNLPYTQRQPPGTTNRPFGTMNEVHTATPPSFASQGLVHHQQQQQQWQANLRALLPDVNISFSAHSSTPAVSNTELELSNSSDRSPSAGTPTVRRPPPGFDQPAAPLRPLMDKPMEAEQLSRLSQSAVEDPSILWSRLELEERPQISPTPHPSSQVPHQAKVPPPQPRPITSAVLTPSPSIAKATQQVTPWTSVVMTTVKDPDHVSKPEISSRRAGDAVVSSTDAPLTTAGATTTTATAPVFASAKTPAVKKPTAKVKPLNMATLRQPSLATAVVPNPPEQNIPPVVIGSKMNELDDFEIDEPSQICDNEALSRPLETIDTRKETEVAKSKKKKKTKKTAEGNSPRPHEVASSQISGGKSNQPGSVAHGNRMTASSAVENHNQAPGELATVLTSGAQAVSPNGSVGEQDMFSRLAESTEKLLQTVLCETEAIKTNTEQLSKDLRVALERCKDFPPSRSDLDKINSLLLSSNFEKFRVTNPGDDVKRLDTTTLERQVETAKREATLWEAKLNDLIRKNVTNDSNGNK